MRLDKKVNITIYSIGNLANHSAPSHMKWHAMLYFNELKQLTMCLIYDPCCTMISTRIGYLSVKIGLIISCSSGMPLGPITRLNWRRLF